MVKYHYKTVWTIALSFLLVRSFFLLQGISEANGIVWGDADPWMRLAAFEEFYQTGDWYNRTIGRMNYPFGDQLEWSRAFDIVIMLGMYPLQLFMDHKSAVLTWAGVISPLCFLGVFHFLIKILEQLKVSRGFFLILCALFTYFALWNVTPFDLGRSDHHSFLMLWFVGAIYLATRLFNKAPQKEIFAIGCYYGAGLWLSPETLPATAAIFIYYGLEWVLNNKKNPAFQTIAAGICLSTLLFILVEHPLLSYFTVKHDRLSIVHGVLIVCATIISYATTVAKVKAPVLRLSFLGVSTLMTLGVMQWLFPGFYYGPLAAYDHAHTPEAQKILESVGEFRNSPPKHMIMHIIFFINIVYWGLKNNKNKFYFFAAVNCALFLVLYLLKWRYIYYYIPSVLIMLYPLYISLYSVVSGHVYERILNYIANKKELFLAQFSCALFGLGAFLWLDIPYYFSVDEYKKYAITPLGENVENNKNTNAEEQKKKDEKAEQETLDSCKENAVKRCKLIDVMKGQEISLHTYIQRYKFDFEKKSVAIMTSENYGPHIVLFTKHKGVGGFYTHNYGIADSRKFFETEKLDEIKNIIKKRDIKLIAFEPRQLLGNDKSVISKWILEDMPKWITVVSSPKTTKGPFILSVGKVTPVITAAQQAKEVSATVKVEDPL